MSPPLVEVLNRLYGTQRNLVEQLLTVTATHDGAEPLSDHLRMDLADPHSATYTGLLLPGRRGLDGYAQLQPNNGVWSLEAVLAPAARAEPEVLAALLAAAVVAVARSGGGDLNWWVLPPGLAGADVQLRRELPRMRPSWPIYRAAGVEVRPFVVGRDELAWLTVNNRA